jgi:hypothetical protein
MAQLKTAYKTLKLLKNEETAISISRLAKKGGIAPYSLKEVIEFLLLMGKIDVMRSGRYTLVRLKKNEVSN